MSKKIFLLYIVVLCIAFTGCAFHGKNEKSDSDELQQYLDKNESIIHQIRNNAYGATGPKLVYANKKNAVLFHPKGILIYNFEKQKITGTIDTVSMQLNKAQGDPRTIVKGERNLVALANSDPIKEKIYQYNIDRNSLQTISMEQFQKIPETKYLNTNQHLEILNVLGHDQNDFGGEAIELEDGSIVMLEYPYENSAKDWTLIFVKEGQIQRKYVIFPS